MKQLGRREFLKAGAAAVAVASGSVPLVGCGGSSPDRRESLQFAVADGRGSPADEYILHVGGEKIPLTSHTPDSLARLQTSRPQLMVGAGRFTLTHYAEDVPMPAASRRVHLTRRRAGAPAGTHELVMVHINVPRTRVQADMERVAAIRERLGLPAPVQSSLAGLSVFGEVVTPIDTAAAIVFHHPELMALDPDVAATVMAHIYSAEGFEALWRTVGMRPGTTGDEESWCEMEQVFDDATGQPMLDDEGNVAYDYRVLDDVLELAGVAIRSALVTTKEDEELRDKLWQTEEGTANQPTERVQAGGLGSAAYEATTTEKGMWDGLWILPSVSDATQRTVRINIINIYQRYAGVYVRFYDDAGKELSLDDAAWSKSLPGGAMLNTVLPKLKKGGWLTSSTSRAVHFVSSPVTILGVPVAPGAREFFVRMPDNARSFRVSCGSLGQNVLRQEGTKTDEIIGLTMTSLFNFVVPTLFLAYAIGQPASFPDKLIGVEEIINISLAFIDEVMLFKEIVFPSSPESLEAALVAMGTSHARLYMQLAKAAVRLCFSERLALIIGWVKVEQAGAQAVANIPFAGWAFRAVSVVGTGVQLLTSSLQCGLSDALMYRYVKLTLNAQLEINPDIENPAGFPAQAKWFEVVVHGPGLTTFTSERQEIVGYPKTLTARIDRLPSGSTCGFSVVMYGEDGRTIVGRGEAATYTVTSQKLAVFTREGQTTAERIRRSIPASKVFDQLGGQSFSTTTQLRNALRNALTVTEYDEYQRGLISALANTSIPLLVSAGSNFLEVECTISEQLAPLLASTRYQHERILSYDAGTDKYEWKATNAAPTVVSPFCDNSGESLCDLPSITLSRRTGDLGYAWRTASPQLPVCGSNVTNTQVYTVQNLSIGPDPNFNRQTLTNRGTVCGVIEGVGVYYEFDGASDGSGANFLLDGRGGDGSSVRVRPINLSAADAFDLAGKGIHYGSFAELPTSLCWHRGGYLIGVNRVRHKMEIIDTNKPLIEDRFSRMASMAGGLGERVGLLHGPSCVAARLDGTVIVLESLAYRVQAFDVTGLPVLAFNGKSSATFSLRDYQKRETYLDMSMDAKGYIYVLSYLGDGQQVADYNLDIYTDDGNWLCNTNGFTAARLIVDYWRNVHTLNWQAMQGPKGRTEPTISRWVPRTPS